jgi:hypothetical protein
MKLGDTVHITKFDYKKGIVIFKTGRIVKITKTIIFKTDSTTITYKLDDGLEYKESELRFDKVLSRDNRLKDILK